MRDDDPGSSRGSLFVPTYLRLGAREPASGTSSYRVGQKQGTQVLRQRTRRGKANRGLVLIARDPCGTCWLGCVSGSPNAPAGNPSFVSPAQTVGLLHLQGEQQWSPSPSPQWHKETRAQESRPLSPESGLATPGVWKSLFPLRVTTAELCVSFGSSQRTRQTGVTTQGP